MKITAIITDASTVRPSLDAAVMAARVDRLARIEALHVVVDPEQLVAASEEVQFQRLREAREGTASDKAAAAQAAFVAWNAGAADDAPRIEWKQPTGAEEETVVRECTDADLVVMAQGQDLDSGDARHAAIRQTGKPLLFVPADWKPRGAAFAHVAVALSDTAAMKDALHGAMPWLRAAEKVTAFRVGSEEDDATAIANELRKAGITVEVRIFKPVSDDLGAEIVALAATIGADMLVAGAYRHGPLIEWLTGSTTRQMLGEAALPLFLAH